jgi:signal transduction histidine kinase
MRWVAALGARIKGLRESHVRVRVGVAATVVALLAATLGSFVFVLSLRRSLTESLVASAEQQADAVVTQLNDGTPSRVAVAGRIDDVTTQVLDKHGAVDATDNSRASRPLRTSPGTSRGVRVKGLHDVYIVVAERARDGSLVVVGKSEEELHSATATAVGLLLVAVPLGVALLAVVIWTSVGRALRPVEGMRREAQDITSDHLHRRLPVPAGNDEISHLARTLNEMLDRIDSAQRLQRQFVSDASHELRSPLAAVRQLTEVAERFPDLLSAQELATEVRAEEQRMEELVAALLTLARLDDGTAGSRAPVDLDDVVIGEVMRANQLASPVDLKVGELAAAQVRGNSLLLAQLVRNLLSNATRHAASRVQVTLEVAGDAVHLRVDDDGLGIPSDQRDQVFERFVRLDEARHRDAGGSGLGLAIVRKVATASGGSVAIEDSPLGGARLAVVLPHVSGAG